jgi:hypothetical protein
MLQARGQAQLLGRCLRLAIGIAPRALCQPPLAIFEASTSPGSLYAALGRFGVAGPDIVEVAGVLLFVTMIVLLC